MGLTQEEGYLKGDGSLRSFKLGEFVRVEDDRSIPSSRIPILVEGRGCRSSSLSTQPAIQIAPTLQVLLPASCCMLKPKCLVLVV